MTKEHRVSGLLTVVTEYREEEGHFDAVLLIGGKRVNLRGSGHTAKEAVRDLNHYIECTHRDIDEYLQQHEPRSCVCAIL